MQEYLSRLDYMDGLGTLQQRAAYRHEIERAYLEEGARHEIRAVLRRRRTLARKAQLKRLRINFVIGLVVVVVTISVFYSILDLSVSKVAP